MMGGLLSGGGWVFKDAKSGNGGEFGWTLQLKVIRICHALKFDMIPDIVSLAVIRTRW